MAEASDCNDFLFVVTGDIAQSGKVTEYSNAKLFFDSLTKNLTDNNKTCLFWFTPGNHDCDFSVQQEIRKILLGSVQKDSQNIADEVISSLLSTQENYRNFCNDFASFENINPLVAKYEKISSTYESIFGYSLNSAWISKIKEQAGTLSFPNKYLPNVSDNGLRVCFFHHTLNWFDPQSNRNLIELINQHFDIVLTGHEHVTSSFRKIDNTTNTETHYLEGGVLFENDSITSEFNLIKIKSGANSYEYLKFNYDQKANLYRKSLASTIPFLRTKHQQLQKFVISQEFSAWLDELGIPFQHSQKDPLCLGDLFVCPDFEENKVQSKTAKNITIKSESFFEEHEQLRHLIIVGPKESGKTSLAKRIFIHHRLKDRAVLFIKGTSLSKKHLTDGSRLQDLLTCTLENQYESFDTDFFKQLPPSQKTVIIDEFHLSELNYLGKQKLLKSLEAIFGFVVILADEVFKFEELLIGATEINIFDLYSLLTIRPFGKRLKSQLIKKWTLLGREYSWEFQDCIRFQEQLLERLESVLENKAILSYPVHILTLLQQIEAGTPTAAMSGSHGYLYDYLIHQELTKIFKSSSIINAIDSYLSHFCFWYFINKKRQILIEEFHSFHNDYIKNYGSTLKAEFILQNLSRIGLFQISDTSIIVRRKYYIAYYASLRFAELFSNNPIQERSTLEELIKKAYLEDVSSFFSCLFHHSNSPLIREVVNNFALSLFSNVEAFDFDVHTSFVKDLGFELERDFLNVDDEDIQKNRDKAIESAEKIDSKTQNTTDDLQNSDFEPDPANISIQINLTFKMIHLIGQMLRTHQGKVEREDQKNTAIICFNLGLRSLSFIANFLKTHKEEILASSKEIFSKASGETEALEDAKKFFYFILQALGTSFVERIAASVGAEELQMIFKDVITEKGCIGFSLIDFAINLTYKRDFPIGYLNDLAVSYEKNHFAFDALRVLVIRHLHLNFVDYKKKAQIANKMKLTTKTMQKALVSSNS